MGILLESIRGVPAFITYFGSATVLVLLFLAIYVRITPYRELALIRDGNVAAACSLSGALLGFVIPLSKAIAQSVSLPDMLLWGAVALIVQLLVYIAVRSTVPEVVTGIPLGKGAHGLFLGIVALAAGVINAACMTY